MDTTGAIELRGQWARANQPIGDLLVNSPAGFPSSYPPGFPAGPTGAMWWIGSDDPESFLRPRGPSAMSAITRATSLIVNTIASLPLRILTGGPSPGTSTIDVPLPRWLGDPQLHRPDQRFGPTPTPASIRLTASQFWGDYLRSALLKGMGYFIHEIGPDGSPVAGTLRLLNPDMVGSHVDDDGVIVRRIGARTGDWVDTDMQGQFVLGSRLYGLMEMNNPLDSPDVSGITRGVIQMHTTEFALAEQAVRYAQGMYRSGVPAGYLKTAKPNFTAEQAESLRQNWVLQHGGDSRSIAVLNATTEFVPIQMSPVDMAMVQMRQMTLVDVANAFGVPAHMLNHDTEKSNTYSNAESRNLDFRQFSLGFWVRALEEVLTSLTPFGQWVQVDFRGLLRSDTPSRYAAYHTALEDGWLTVDEVRRQEGMAPLGEASGNPPAAITEGGSPQEGVSDAGSAA